VSPHLSIEFVDRQHITAMLKFADVDRVFACGDFSRRQGEGSYLDKVVRTLPGGKLELDIALIRRRIAAVGSCYVAK